MAGVPLSTKEVVYECSDFIIYIERYLGLLWFHTDVFRWTPTIAKAYKKQVKLVLDSFKRDIFALNEEEGHKKRGKFGESIGFEFLSWWDFGTHTAHRIYRRKYNG